MCNRLVRSSESATICARFSVRTRPIPPAVTSWNVRARHRLPVIRMAANRRRELALLKWGLELDHHALSTEDGVIVAITALELRRAALLQDLFSTNRCIVPVDAFYAGPPQHARGGHHWAFALDDSSIMGVAAMWLPHADGTDRCAIITTGPNESLALVDERMPAILYPEDERAWLAPSTNPYAAYNLIMPYPAEMMRGWPVAKAREASLLDGPELLRRVA